ncbi:MAG: hypothetical protein QXF86_04610 [Candidatus Bilamarchaeaceae archaeon]
MKTKFCPLSSNSVKKILIISYSYPPVNAPAAQMPYFVAKHIKKHGWDTVILTAKYPDSSLSYSLWGGCEIGVIKAFNFIISPFRKLHGKIYGESFPQGRFANKFFKKILNFIHDLCLIPDKGITWLPFAVFKGFLILLSDKEIKVILSTAPLWTNHIVALILKKIFKLPWLASFRDYFYIENFENEGSKWRRKVFKTLESCILKNANVITFVTESLLKRYCQFYPFISRKSVTIHNGFEPSEFTNNAEDLVSKPLTIFYSGTSYRGERSILPLLLTLERALEHGIVNTSDISIIIAGPMEDASVYSSFNFLKISESIKFLGTLSRREVLKLMKSSHLLLLLVPRSNKFSHVLPIKLFEYVGSQRPILAFAPQDSEAARFISELKCGFILSNDISSESISMNLSVIEKIVQIYKSGELSKPLMLEWSKVIEFTWEQIAYRYAEVLKKMLFATKFAK